MIKYSAGLKIVLRENLKNRDQMNATRISQKPPYSLLFGIKSWKECSSKCMWYNIQLGNKNHCTGIALAWKRRKNTGIEVDYQSSISPAIATQNSRLPKYKFQFTASNHSFSFYLLDTISRTLPYCGLYNLKKYSAKFHKGSAKMVGD